MSLDTQHILRNPCPPRLCNCGYYNIVSDQSETCIDSVVQKHPGLGIMKMQETVLIADIESITTLDAFNALRNSLRIKQGIMFLVQGNGDIRVEIVDGLCRKTRKKVKDSFEKVFAQNQELLITILNRDSLFSEERE